MPFIDLSQNYSFYAIPVAWLLTNIPGVYAKSLGGTNYDIASPRKFAENVEKDQKLDKATKSRILRSEAASANGRETLSLFAASVIAANYAGVPVETINKLVAVYLGTRAAYNYTYVFLQDNPSFAPVRTVVWNAGVISWMTLLIKAGNRL
ncbi:hypothetical protein F5Y12DRAFT_315822 [Xylaria sp. FL1777]|nr:hypothetical protein F5Y12DRAFT_315822 [Xylaria sp. FL1777]